MTAKRPAEASGGRRPRLLVVSTVLPYPGAAGQEQRVRNKLLSLGEQFDVTFLTVVRPGTLADTRERLLELCQEALLLESRYWRSPAARIFHRLAATAYAALTGLKTSNYVTGELELTPARVDRALGERRFEAAIFEYWHAYRAVEPLRRRGIPCVLDMHDILWQAYRRQLDARFMPDRLRELRVERYRRREESAWTWFDALVAINAEEHAYVRRRLPEGFALFFAPMGVDLDAWSFAHEPATPPRVAYYGSLGTPHNQRDAWRCCETILPLVWRQRPDVELWLVGSRPPERLRALAEREPRVRVTGFVDDVPSLLRTMTLVLCPWSGTYGFRSRLVEVMALGIPVVASPDAVAGMDLEPGAGIFLEVSDQAMAERVLDLLNNPRLVEEQGSAARRSVERKYSFETTYRRFSRELAAWLR